MSLWRGIVRRAQPAHFRLCGSNACGSLDFLGPGMRLMTKPFTLELLAETVAGALASPALA